MRYQQNLKGRTIAIVVLSTPQWPVVRLHLDRIAAAVNAAMPVSYVEAQETLPVADLLQNRSFVHAFRSPEKGMFRDTTKSVGLVLSVRPLLVRLPGGDRQVSSSGTTRTICLPD